MAAAAGKKSTTSLSLMDAYGLEVEEELSTLVTQYWAEVRIWNNVRKRSLDKTGSRS